MKLPAPQASCWWRFTRYQMRKGYIRPARGAKLVAYDPLEKWSETRASHRRSFQIGVSMTPYQSLMDLLASLRYQRPGEASQEISRFSLERDPSPPPLSTDSEARLLAWCADWGLLGVLPHFVRQVTLTPPNEPQWNSTREWEAHFQVQYNWTSRGWQERLFRTLQDSWIPAGVLYEAGGRLGHDQLTGVWSTFFPDVPVEQRAVFPYPLPLTDDFWRIYSEPISRFVSTALLLQDAIRTAGVRGRARSSMNSVPVDFLSGAAHISDLVAPVRLQAELKPRTGVKIGWGAPSLLSMLATMAFADLSDDQSGVRAGRSIECAACGRTFIARAYQARYCSERCRWRQQQRNYRARPRRKKGKAARPKAERQES